MDKKKLLILNGSHSEITIIQAAQQLGFYVVTTGNNPSLIGHSYADEYICADYSDEKEILEIVQKNNIDCIVACANDFGVLTASFVAEEMGWQGHDSYENASLLHNKDQFKTFIQDIGIRCPVSIAFSDYEKALWHLHDVEYPIIVKAVDLTGGKGIMRADDYEAAVIAVDNAFSKSRSKKIVIEPFIEGIQQSIVTFLHNGKVIASVSNDVYSPINPYLIQSETLPAMGIEAIQNELHGFIQKIALQLGLVDGMFTMQYIVKDGKPFVIEAMRRCLGNQYLTVAHASTGFPWEEALVRAETGMELSNLQIGEPRAKYVGHHGIMAKSNGTLRSYSIDSDLAEHIFKKIEIINEGEKITDFLNERIAYIYYEYDNREEMDNVLSNINDRIHIELED